MSILNQIKVDTVYTRSANLERDIDSSAIVKAYVPTSRSILTLRRITSAMDNTDMPRSWALIGPYGSGKSSFAVFLAHLLEPPHYETTAEAIKVCREIDKDLSDKIEAKTSNSRGFLSILLTGTPEPLGRRFLSSLKDAVLRFWQTIPGRPPAIIAKVMDAAVNPDISIHEIIALLKEVRVAIESKNGRGILIVFDELGKFLEYEARHYGANDIYLLQALAETAAKGRKTNIFIITLMHQGFEQYARGLGDTLRNEWSKVQGRFENIPFLESTEQTLRIIGKALLANFTSSESSKITDKVKKISKVLCQEKALPTGINQETATQIFADCYPLHPLTALILPILCQKMAQNERTLFSYLGSKEQHGFYDSISKFEKFGEWVMPWDIFDYFILNQPAVVTDPTTHRRWAEVITAIERLGDFPEKYISLLKTIGLLNIIGAQGGLKASKNIINLCASSKKAATMATNALVESSVLHFRKFSNEFRVWQGSDFDLDAAINEELNQIGRFDLADALNTRKPLQPVVARRHTIKTGALRYFIPSFVDAYSYRKVKSKEEQQRLIFCLAETEEEIEVARKEILTYFSSQDVVAISPNGSQLREAVAEVLALERVENNCPELQSDPIIKREFYDRLSAANRLEDELLHNLAEHPDISSWYWKGQILNISNKRDLQIKLSSVLDEIYKLAPQIHNELINRDKPSAQAAAARNKLVVAMLHNADKADLAIEKFPAEKAIYRSYLHATGLHIQTSNGDWKLSPPDKEDQYNFYPVWEKIENFLESSIETPRSFAELNSELQAPPFGVKVGILPLLYLTAFLCNQEDLALYEERVYVPYITDQTIERFMKRPDYFTVQRIRMHGLRASIFQEYAKVLYGKNADNKTTLLSIAKPLAKFMASLPDYTKQTNRLSDSCIKTRKAFDLSKSPIDLLFHRLPVACGYPSINPEETDTKKIEGFSAALVEVIRELRDAFDTMLDETMHIFAQALFPDITKKMDLKTIRQKAAGRYEDLIEYTVDSKGLRPFLKHLVDAKGSDELWLKRLLLFLGGRAAEKWSDVDRDNSLRKIEEFARRVIDLRVLQDHYMKNKSKFEDDFDIIRLRSMRHGKSENDEIVRINSSTKQFIQSNKKEFQKILDRLDEGSKLALLAELVDDFLSEKENKKQNNINDKEAKIING